MRGKKKATKSVPKKEKTPIPQREKIDTKLNIREWPWTEKQKQLIELAQSKESQVIFIKGPAGSSKAQPVDSDVLTPSGWVKMGHLKRGDLVYSSDGKPTKILEIYPQGLKDIYVVEFSDGTSTECCGDHLWHTQTDRDRNFRRKKNNKRYSCPQKGSAKTTIDILNSLTVRKGTRINHSIPMTESVNFQEKNHFISPYILGILLGDGCFRQRPSFSTADNEVIKFLLDELPKGVEIKYKSQFDYFLKDKSLGFPIKNSIKNELKRLNLWGLKSNEKFIPDEYLFDCSENRLDIIRGLMDSDGHVAGKGYATVFTTTSKKLSQGMRFLIESFGGKVSEKIHENFYTYNNEYKKGQNSFSLHICLPPDINPFRLTRKQCKVIPKSKYKPVRYIKNISKLTYKKECRCILVENKSHLYLTNNFIVTHNTHVAMYVALNLINNRSHSEIIYVRSAVESADSHVGLLPGELDDKLSVYKTPLVDKLYDFLSKDQINYLVKDERVIMTAPNFCRGTSWNGKVVILDENQNSTLRESITVLTRLGKFCKCFVLADPQQTDLNNGKRGGFDKLYEEFSDDESKSHGIHVFEFTKEDIVRGGLCQFIVEKSEKINQKINNK